MCGVLFACGSHPSGKLTVNNKFIIEFENIIIIMYFYYYPFVALELWGAIDI